jgi:hypothetical protein
MKKVFAVLLLCAVTAPAFAGEDSTDKWGDGGNGPAFYESPCSLEEFQGNVPLPEKCRPATEPVHRRAAAAPSSISAAEAPAPISAAPASTTSPSVLQPRQEPRQ